MEHAPVRPCVPRCGTFCEMLYFQEVCPAEAELDGDHRKCVR